MAASSMGSPTRFALAALAAIAAFSATLTLLLSVALGPAAGAASASSTTTRLWQAARMMAVSAVAVMTSPSLGSGCRAGAAAAEVVSAIGEWQVEYNKTTIVFRLKVCNNNTHNHTTHTHQHRWILRSRPHGGRCCG